jgi:hypothetical protein
VSHACPIEGCSNNRVPDGIFMCARHWRLVPRPLQKAVYAAYRSGLRASNSQNHREAIRVVEGAERGRAVVALPAGTMALTVWQPWASLIMIGAKPWEFRKWNFTDKPHLAKLVGQRIVMHAGARKPTQNELRDLLHRIEEGESALDARLATPLVSNVLDALIHKSAVPVPLGAALGTIVIGEPRSVLDIFRDQVADSDRLDEHMCGWPMSDPQPFPEPIPSAGAQGFWCWS